MKKIITMIGALALAGSSSVGLLHLKNFNSENLKLTTQKPVSRSNIYNHMVFNNVTSNVLDFNVTLSNGTYCGFWGFLQQINPYNSAYGAFSWGMFFFQWLDDNDFHYTDFPDLNYNTLHGFWNRPFLYSNRFEEHMGHFGGFLDDKSDTARFSIHAYWSWATMASNATNDWKAACASQKPPAAITFDFYFTYTGGKYSAATPTFHLVY